MSLSNEQWSFARDVGILLHFLTRHKWKFTFGEAERTEEQQQIYLDQGRSWTRDSQHLKKLAIDLNLFAPDFDGSGFTYIGNLDTAEAVRRCQFIGDFWEDLDKRNSWGGNWSVPDVPHFQKDS